MGDIIYTTPVVRCLKLQLPGAEIHFLTKPVFQYIYAGNPYIDKLLLLRQTLNETIKEIRQENYNCIIDLHSNLRTGIIKYRTGIKSFTYNKQTILKWLSLRLKHNLVPPTHLVNRYFKAVQHLGVKNDHRPVDYFIKQPYELKNLLPENFVTGYVAFIIGAAHFTKRMPNEKVVSVCDALALPVVLLGGKDVVENALEVIGKTKAVIYNACGKTSLDESVFIVSKAQSVIGFDTGLTHIAEAFNKPIASVWGSTVPELLGVQPYEIDRSLVAGVTLPCRPCSKFGLPKCPLGHFKCMWNIDESTITDFINAGV